MIRRFREASTQLLRPRVAGRRRGGRFLMPLDEDKEMRRIVEEVAGERVKELEEAYNQSLAEFQRGIVFDSAFRMAVFRGGAREAERDVLRELFLADPDAFDMATAYPWVRADEVSRRRSQLLWEA